MKHLSPHRAPPLREGYVDKGGRNTPEMQLKHRPADPAPMRAQTRKVPGMKHLSVVFEVEDTDTKETVFVKSKVVIDVSKEAMQAYVDKLSNQTLREKVTKLNETLRIAMVEEMLEAAMIVIRKGIAEKVVAYVEEHDKLN